MVGLLIIGAIIALGVMIYSSFPSDGATTAQQEHAKFKQGEKGCMWLLICIGGILIIAFAKMCVG